jgi:hypothetical protein
MSVGGFNTVWKHGTHGAISSNTDFTAKTMSLGPDFDSEEADATVFGTGDRSYEPTFESGVIPATYHYDATVLGQLAAIRSGRDTVTFEIGPDGTTAGYAKITGSMIMTKLSLTGLEPGQVIKISVSWRVSGSPTFTTY